MFRKVLNYAWKSGLAYSLKEGCIYVYVQSTFKNVNSASECTLDPEENLKNKHKKMIVTQAFQDVGVTSPLIVKLDKNKAASCICSFTSSGQPAVYVTINPNFDDAALYTVAGHEAVHALHNHEYLTSLLSICLLSAGFGLKLSKFTPYAGFVYIAFQYVNRLIEKDADITSAIKLSTTKELIELCKFWHQQMLDSCESTPFKNIKTEDKVKIKIAVEKMIGSHPLDDTRVAYLSKLPTTGSPLLFKTQAWQDIVKEREQFIRNKPRP